VGRERELTVGSRLIAEAVAGRGALLLISGEAGIGKTALATALGVMAARQGARVVVGRCYDLTETPPYGPWRELLQQFSPVGGVPLPLATDGQDGDAGGVPHQHALFAAVRAFLVAATTAASGNGHALVLVLDDLHWADAASLDLLHYLARQIAALPILLIVTYRVDEISASHRLVQVLPALVREADALARPPARLDLRRLDDAAVAALVRASYRLGDTDMARLVTYLRERAAGNPFFMGEILRTLEEAAVLCHTGDRWTLGDMTAVGVPVLLRQVIDRRIARLGDVARDLLAGMAVIGQEVPLDLWETIDPTSREDLSAVMERAIAAHLLESTADDAAVRFAHPLIRQALYEGIAPPRRHLWHARIAAALIARAGAEPDTVAFHLQRAGDPRAMDWLVQAGVRAQRAFAWETAADRFAAAADLMGRRGAARARGWLLLRVAWLRRFAHPHAGIATLDEAVAIAQQENDRALAAYTAFYRGLVRFHSGDVRQGLGEMVAAMVDLDALAALPQDDVATDIAYAGDPGGTLVGFLAGAGRYAEALAIGERIVARSVAETAASPARAAAQTDAAHGLAITYAALGRAEAAADAFVQARSVFRARGQQFAVGESAMDELRWVVLPYHADDCPRRDRLAHEAEAAWTRARNALDALPPRLARLPLLFVEGGWEEALPIAVVGRERGFFRNMARSVLGPLARAQGESDLAWAVVREDLPAGPQSAPGDTYFPTALILLRLAAALALDDGDLPVSRAWLEAHDRWLAASGTVLGRAEGALGWAEWHRATGDMAQARERAMQALMGATAPRQPLGLLAAHRFLGVLDADAGAPDAARAHFDTALTLADACAAPYERALTLAASAATQDAADAEAALLTAREIAERLGARPLLWQVAARLGRLWNRGNRAVDARRAYHAAQTLIAALAAGRADGVARERFRTHALAEIPPAYRRPYEPAHGSDLTLREHDIVAQVALGKSNREIAAALSIAEKTVEMHVSNSLSKLGFRSRAQLAAWSATREAASGRHPGSASRT
jgi:DNA-binding CsgD family transcriptional regulator